MRRKGISCETYAMIPEQMMPGITILICILLSVSFHAAHSLTCLSCDSITQPRHCHYVARCNVNEICGAEMLTTTTGYPSYKLGCFTKDNCQNRTAVHGPLCKQCCNTDLCNAKLCGEPDYPTTRGPICYDCPFHTKRQPCRKIQFCSEDEECSIQAAEEFGNTFVTSSCKRKHLCPTSRSAVPAPVVGKRSLGTVRSASRPVCESCCWQDLCNLNCSTVDHCSDSSCRHGVCVTHNSSSVCNCSSGWQGDRCDRADLCSSSPCGIGTCQLSATFSYTCTCSRGWSGPFCTVSSLDCDFEAGMCSWTQGRNDNFDWTRNVGRTATSGTGPNGDHTTGSGYYMYIEASSPRRIGDKADLESASLSPGHTYCMDLALNMYGRHMGAINIYIQPEHKAKFLIQYFKQENSTTAWYVRKIPIPPQPHDFTIVIEGVRGSGYQSDAAIDDIYIKPGDC